MELIGKDLSTFGMGHTYVDLQRPETWEQHLTAKTRVFYVEATTNPMMEIGDLKAVVQFAKAHQLIAVIDNTFPSPVNFNPIPFGFDLAVHSATKYLNGHSDLIAGAVMGSAALIARIHNHLNHWGGCLDPHACFLLQRGLKTLTLRVERQNENALGLARYLESHSALSKVLYPGLASHPHHQRAREYFRGFGGMLSFELKGGLKAALALKERLELALYAPSLGGVESLITIPSLSSHAGLSLEEKKASGVSESLCDCRWRLKN